MSSKINEPDETSEIEDVGDDFIDNEEEPVPQLTYLEQKPQNDDIVEDDAEDADDDDETDDDPNEKKGEETTPKKSDTSTEKKQKTSTTESTVSTIRWNNPGTYVEGTAYTESVTIPGGEDGPHEGYCIRRGMAVSFREPVMPGKHVDRIGIVDRTFKEKSAKGGRVRIQTIVPIDTVERVPDWAKIEVHSFPVALVTDHWVTLRSAGHGLSSLRPIVVNRSLVHETAAFSWVAKSGKENAPTAESEKSSPSSTVRVLQAARYWVLMDQYAKEHAKEVCHTLTDQTGKTRKRKTKEYSFSFVDPSEAPANTNFKEYIDKNNFTAPPVSCLCKNEAGYTKKVKTKKKGDAEKNKKTATTPSPKKHQHHDKKEHKKKKSAETNAEKEPEAKRRKKLPTQQQQQPPASLPEPKKEQRQDKHHKNEDRDNDGAGAKVFGRVVKYIEMEMPDIEAAIEKKTAPHGANDWLALLRVFCAAVNVGAKAKKH